MALGQNARRGQGGGGRGAEGGDGRWGRYSVPPLGDESQRAPLSGVPRDVQTGTRLAPPAVTEQEQKQGEV